MNRATAGAMSGDVYGAVLSDRDKRRAGARIIGQCYITALACMRHNREQVAEIAEILVQRKELYGDEVTDVLERARLEAPPVDVLDDELWPKL